MAQQSKTDRTEYTPYFDRLPERWGRRIAFFTTVAALGGAALTALGFRWITPSVASAQLAVRVDSHNIRINRVERLVDTLTRSVGTSTYISCELFKRQFPRVPVPEGCP